MWATTNTREGTSCTKLQKNPEETCERRIKGWVGKRTRYFCIVFQIKKVKGDCKLSEISEKKADPEMFLFWVNGIFAKKQALFSNCELIPSCKCNCPSVQTVQN